MTLPATLVLVSIVAAISFLYVRRRRLFAREQYQRHLEDALADGVLTEEEADELDAVRRESELSDHEVRMVALSVYRRALRDAIADARITRDEESALARLQAQLELSAEDLAEDSEQLRRVHLLARIERDELPSVRTPLTLDPGEICHWAVQGRLAQKLALPGSHRDKLEPVRFRVDAAEPFHIDGRRDSLGLSEAILPQDVGMLVVTSRRTVFQGARRSLTVPHVKLSAVSVYRDGLSLEQEDGMQHYLLVDDAELTSAILLAAARRRRAEIRPNRPISA